MELSAVLLARVIAFVDIYDLNPRGHVFYPDLVRSLAQRYEFLSYPQKFEDLDESKGVKFQTGKFRDTTIEQLIIYNNGIILDTRSSTNDSKGLLLEALTWASNSLGLEYRDGVITQMTFASHLIFHSNAPLHKINPVFNKIAERISESVTRQMGEKYEYQPVSIRFNFDQLGPQRKPAQFTIERREGSLFSEDKYFSIAPLETLEHVKLIEELEADLGAN